MLRRGIAQARYGVLHSECRKAATYGMVLVGQGSPEESHYPIALNIIDHAVVAMNRFLHGIQYRPDAPHGLLGVNRRNQLGGIANVREQHGQALSFSTAGAQASEIIHMTLGGELPVHLAACRNWSKSGFPSGWHDRKPYIYGRGARRTLRKTNLFRCYPCRNAGIASLDPCIIFTCSTANSDIIYTNPSGDYKASMSTKKAGRSSRQRWWDNLENIH